MRKIAVVAAAGMVAALAALAPAGERDDAIPLVNSSFEAPGEAALGWEVVEGARTGQGDKASEVVLDRSVARSGKTSLRLSGDASTRSWRMARQEIAVGPREWLRLSVSARMQDVTADAGQFRNANATLEFLDAAGKRLRLLGTEFFTGTRDWTELDVMAAAPDGAAKARVGLLLSMSGTLWFDDVRLDRIAADPETEAGREMLFDRLAEHARRTYPFFGAAGRPQADEWIARGRAKCVAAPGRNELFSAFRELLAEFHDVHVTIGSPKGPLPTVPPSDAPRNWNVAAVRKSLTETLAAERNLLAGRIGSGKDAIGYLLIGTWAADDQATAAKTHQALDALADTKALILDVRPNGGGDENLAARVAARFAAADVVFGRSRVRDPAKPALTDAFLPSVDRVLRAAAPGKADARPVIVLQGPHCVSSNEAFVQMMAALPTVTTMGANTRGASGNAAPFEVMPSVHVTIPRWQTLTLDGTLLEGRGSDPEVRAEFPAEAFQDADPLLAAAIERLGK